MCAHLLTCPLCSQPGFLTLDALRAGLVSVATRPLACPICNEVLLGIDKLTIHLFGHTINQNNIESATEVPKITSAVSCNNVQELIHGKLNISKQDEDAPKLHKEEKVCNPALNHDIKIFSKVPIISLPKETSFFVQSINIRDSSNIVNSVSPHQNEDLSLKTNQIIYIQNLSQLQEIYPQAEHVEQSVPIQKPLCQVNDTNVKNNSCEQKLMDNTVSNYVNQYTQCKISPNLKLQSEPSKEQENIPAFQTTWIKNICNDSSQHRHQESVVPSIITSDENKSQQHLLEMSTVITTIGSASSDSNVPGFQSVSCIPTSAQPSCYMREDSIPISSEAIPAKDISDKQSESSNQSGLLSQLEAFKILETKQKMVRCDICGFHFPDSNILLLHKQLIHTIDEKDFNIKSDNMLKSYPCHLCSKVFKMRGSLMIHMRVSHMGYNLGSSLKHGETASTLNDNGYNCPTCGKNFKKEQHVTQHLKTHEGKQWECDVCNKMFTTKYFLKKHKRLHSGEMPYKCTICDKTFTFQQSYHKHRLYHKDDKPHTCATCGRSFKELSTLHNHERIHTGEKPFACETCGKCFRQRISYLVHRRIHTGALPYKCTACGKSFRYKVSQRTHKCPAQPPGTVVRQSDNLVERLMQASQIKDDPTKSFDITKQHTISNQKNLNEDKYILIVNTNGQPTLPKHLNIEAVNSTNKETNENCTKKYNKDNEEFIKDLWNPDVTNEIPMKKHEFPIKEHALYEKVKVNDTNDFFTMVMSPLENELPSPSTEMEHLRLSSPVDREEQLGRSDNYNNSSNNYQNYVDNIQEHFQGRSRIDSLQTINEESLNQLLYGIHKKQ
ncbi:zinc finger protein 267 [Orussus abietinus]|uniref:zinc finger protein 267 n=1 Tax=Orussus abietinus TaxID=222816 RepID=UPI0006257B81|nr:zinc finger protein 267 [Orussus abietinus]